MNSAPSNSPAKDHRGSAQKIWNVALIGNPNTGKSTLFNALAGMNARVGNYPGVTVEKKVGRLTHAGQVFNLIDLPGTYSLSPRSADEMVSVRVLLDLQPQSEPLDAVICIVDGLHLQRNLYLFSQILDLGVPTILAVNMWDEVQKQQILIDLEELEKRLGTPVVPVCARKREGVDEVKQRLVELLSNSTDQKNRHLELFPDVFQQARQQLQQTYQQLAGRELPIFLAERMLLDINGETEKELLVGQLELKTKLEQLRAELLEQNCPLPAIEPRVRYAWAKKTLSGLIQTPAEKPQSRAEKLDRWLTHRLTGPVIFAAIMLLIFQSIYSWAGPLMDGIEAVQGLAAGLVESVLTPGALRSLLVDGVVAGVGSVLVFLPQIAILFLFVAILEDCGYLARAAYIMDRLMTKVGLSGKSFVPLMSSYACAIPGMMATRTIENSRDRMVTILIAPLMSCSARLPVYLLLINAFIPDDRLVGSWISTRGVTLFCFYLLGTIVAIPIACVLKKTWFKGEPAPFVMELPPFKWPSARVVLNRVWDRSLDFVKQAGSLIFLTTILVWAAGYFPGDHAPLDMVTEKLESQEWDENDPEFVALEKNRRILATTLLNESFLGQAGHYVEPMVAPLGWDWRIGMAVISSFPAREVVIGTLGTIFSLGGDVEHDDEGLLATLQSARHPDGRPLFNLPVALSVMVFFALCAQCGATLMVMKKETNHWKWPVFAFSYMTALAYLGALLAYQLGMVFSG